MFWTFLAVGVTGAVLGATLVMVAVLSLAFQAAVVVIASLQNLENINSRG